MFSSLVKRDLTVLHPAESFDNAVSSDPKYRIRWVAYLRVLVPLSWQRSSWKQDELERHSPVRLRWEGVVGNASYRLSKITGILAVSPDGGEKAVFRLLELEGYA